MSNLFLVYSLAHLALFVWLVRIWRGTDAAAALVLMVPQFFLVYDNLMLGVGRLIGPGDALLGLSWPRFWAHWLAGCWMIVAAGSIARMAAFRWAKPKWVMGSFCLLTVALVVHDLPNFWQVQLYPACEGDTVRYTSRIRAGTSCDDPAFVISQRDTPLAPIITSLVLIAVGAALAFARRFPWMLLGSGLMFVFAMPMFNTLGLANFGEILIAGGVIWAVARFAPQRPAVQQAAAGV